MLSAEKLYAPLDVQRRTDRRVAYLEPCFIQSDSHALWVRSINVSNGGMCIAINEFGVLKRETNLAVFIQNFEPIDAQIRWTRGNIAGVKFLTPIIKHPQLSAMIKQLFEDAEVRSLMLKKNVDAKLPHNLHEILHPTPAESKVKTSTVIPKPDHADKRAYKRLEYTEKCLIRTGKRTFQAQSQNISEGGMCLRLRGLGKVDIGSNIQIILEGGYPPIDATMRWMKDRDVGVQFREPIKGHPIFRDISEQDDTE